MKMKMLSQLMTSLVRRSGEVLQQLLRVPICPYIAN